MLKNLPDLIEDFLRYLKVQRGRTSLTVRNYQLYLKRFLSWGRSSSLGQAADITRERLRDYRLWLSHQRSQSGSVLASSTQNYHLTALRTFVNYLRHKDIQTLPASSITLNPPETRRVTSLTTADLKILLQTIHESNEPELVKLRDLAMVELISATGLKVSELVALEREHINSLQLMLKRKNKEVTLRLPLEVGQMLQDYVTRRPDDSLALFVRHDRALTKGGPNRLTPRSVQRSLERYRKLAGLKQKITPHTLRHAFAYKLAAGGADLVTLQKSLGLKHSATAHVYTQTKT